jgi:hypothetical protein
MHSVSLLPAVPVQLFIPFHTVDVLSAVGERVPMVLSAVGEQVPMVLSAVGEQVPMVL